MNPTNSMPISYLEKVFPLFPSKRWVCCEKKRSRGKKRLQESEIFAEISKWWTDERQCPKNLLWWALWGWFSFEITIWWGKKGNNSGEFGKRWVNLPTSLTKKNCFCWNYKIWFHLWQKRRKVPETLMCRGVNTISHCLILYNARFRAFLNVPRDTKSSVFYQQRSKVGFRLRA